MRIAYSSALSRKVQPTYSTRAGPGRPCQVLLSLVQITPRSRFLPLLLPPTFFLQGWISSRFVSSPRQSANGQTVQPLTTLGDYPGRYFPSSSLFAKKRRFLVSRKDPLVSSKNRLSCPLDGVPLVAAVTVVIEAVVVAMPPVVAVAMAIAISPALPGLRSLMFRYVICFPDLMRQLYEKTSL